MNEEERRKEAEKIYNNNPTLKGVPKIRKAMRGLFKTLGNDKNLTGFSISSGGEEFVSLSREDIDRVNNIKRK